MANGVAGELLARASRREDLRPEDARAGAVYQRVTVDGQPYFVKQLSPASDWIMRVTGDRVPCGAHDGDARCRGTSRPAR